MKGRKDIPKPAGVSVDENTNKKNRPDLNYREDIRNMPPVWGLISQMVISVALSCLTGLIVTYLLSIIAGLFSAQIEKTMEVIIWWLWPSFAVFFMWKYFDVRTHVEIGEGAFATLSLGGGWQFPWRRFNGEVSTFPWIRVWRHNLGGNTTDVECASAFVRVEHNNPDNKDVVQVFSEGDKPPKLFFSYIPLNPFKMVRRIAQDGPDVGFENLNDIAEAVLKEALQHPTVDLSLLMNSHEFAQKLRKAFQELKDDEGNPRCYEIMVGDRKKEYVIDTGYGLGIYNVQAKDLGPSKAIRDEMSAKMQKLIEAKGKAAALAITTEAIKLAGDHAENAMILSGDLDGEEVKIQRQDISIGFRGLSGSEAVEVSRNLANVAPAVAAAFSSGSQSHGRQRRKEDRKDTKDGEKKK